MGAGGALVIAGLVLGGMTARADAPELKSKTRDPERLAPFGLMLDAGIPEGTGLSPVFRPSRFVRLHAGGTHNSIRMGGRAGLTVLPMQGWYTPSFSFEVGQTLPGNSGKLARRMADGSQPPIFSMELAQPYGDNVGKDAKGGRFVYMMPSAKFGLVFYFG
jgi:hypothetical protein